MTRRPIVLVLVGFLVVAFCATALAAKKDKKAEDPPQRILKKRIAVMPMDVSVENWSWYWGARDFAGGLTELFTTELVNTNRFIVVERAALEDIFTEQDLAAEGRTTEETGAQTGRLIGAEWLLRGNLTSFQHKQSGGGGGIGIGGFRIRGRKESAQLAIDCRIFDSTTGQVMASKHVQAKASGGGAGFRYGAGSFNVDAEGFRKTPLGEAMRDAVQKWVAFIVEELGTKPWEGRIVTITEKGIYVNGGSELGVYVGDEFDVYREGEKLIDPATGLELGSERTKVGSIRITQVQEKFSIAEAITGEGFQRNDALVEARLAPYEPPEEEDEA
ncbi:MAG: CsgG/HfaB family protein [Armatimonadota bacterium]